MRAATGVSAGVTLATGANSLTAQATDAAGNTGTSAAFVATLDTTPPTLAVSGISPDTGVSASDGLTDVATVAVSGTIDAADAGLTVAVYDGATLVGTTTANAGGNWSFAGVTLASGANSLTAQATDAAGNTGTSAAFVATLDTTPPTVLSVAASPASGTETFEQVITLTVTLSEPIVVSGGTPRLLLNDGGTASYNAAATAALGDPTKLVFSYTVLAADQTVSGLAVTGINLNGATVTDRAGNATIWSGLATSFPGLGVNTAIGPRHGGEFLVNTVTAGDQEAPSVAGLSSGGFVVTWEDNSGIGGDASGFGIKAQMFDANGAKIGSEFLVNTVTTHDQDMPSVTGLPNGGFVVTWQDNSSSSTTSIKAQMFDANGAKVGSEFLVNTSTANIRWLPYVTALSNGNFVVTWTDFSGTLGDSSSGSAKAQLFSANGTKIGTEFLVNTSTANEQEPFGITALANGGFVVMWSDSSGTGDVSGTWSVKAQVYDGTGNRVGSELDVNTQTQGNQLGGSVAGLSNGNFVVTWEDDSGIGGDASGYGIKGQLFGANGTKIGTEFLVNTQTASDQTLPEITALSNGGYVITWQDASGTLGDASGTSIKAQVFDANGNKFGSELLINSQTGGNQTAPTIGALANGGFVVTWSDASGTLGDSTGSSVKAQMFYPFTSPPSILSVTGNGVLASGATTNDNNLTVRVGLPTSGGLPVVGDTVQLFNGSVAVGPAVALTSANLTAGYVDVQTGALNDGAYALTARFLDSVPGTATPFDVTVNTTPLPRHGGEFLVNTVTAGDQEAPSVAGLSSGGFVVTWEDNSGIGGDASGFGIKAQMFDANGAKIGSEFLVNTVTTHDQDMPSVTGLPNGGFVVTWQDNSSSSTTSIKAQMFDANGAKVGSEFLVNTSTANIRWLPYVTALSNGNFVVTWTDFSGTLGDSSSGSAKAQLFSANGTKIGTEFLVNTSTANEQEPFGITALANGGFVVMWSDSSGTGDVSGTWSVKAQVYDGTGNRVGSELDVNTQTQGNQLGGSVAGLSNGNFVVTWEDDSGIGGDASGYGIKGQLFGANGTKIGTEFLVNTQTASDQTLPEITALSNGGYVITWQDASGTLGDASGTSIKAQVFDANGNKFGSELLINSQTGGNQTAPTIGALANGGFVVTWSDASGTLGDSTGSSVKAQMFYPFGSPDVGTLTGTAGNDTLTGGPGNEIFNGGGGSDTLIGGGGYDTYQFNSAFGQTTINNAAADGITTSRGEIDFGAGLTEQNLWFAQNGNNLQIDVLGTAEQVTVAGWFAGNARAQVDSINATADGAKLDTSVAQLVSAMAAYSAANPGFNPASATQMPNDSGVQGAIAASWHH